MRMTSFGAAAARPMLGGGRDAPTDRSTPASAASRPPPGAGSVSPRRACGLVGSAGDRVGDRKSTRLNSSHGYISYAVFCLKKKKNTPTTDPLRRIVLTFILIQSDSPLN